MRPGNPAAVSCDQGLGTLEGKSLSHGFAPSCDPMDITPAAAYPFLSHAVLLTGPSAHARMAGAGRGLCALSPKVSPGWDEALPTGPHRPRGTQAIVTALRGEHRRGEGLP